MSSQILTRRAPPCQTPETATRLLPSAYITPSELAYQKGRLHETNTCADHTNVVAEIGPRIRAWLEEVPDHGFAATKQWIPGHTIHPNTGSDHGEGADRPADSAFTALTRLHSYTTNSPLDAPPSGDRETASPDTEEDENSAADTSTSEDATYEDNIDQVDACQRDISQHDDDSVQDDIGQEAVSERDSTEEFANHGNLEDESPVETESDSAPQSPDD